MSALIIARGLNFVCGALALGIPAVLAFAVLPPIIGSERAAGERVASMLEAMLRRLLYLAGAAVGLGLLSGGLWLVLTGCGLGLAALLLPMPAPSTLVSWLVLALGIGLFVPLVRFPMATLALEWNRHR